MKLARLSGLVAGLSLGLGWWLVICTLKMLQR